MRAVLHYFNGSDGMPTSLIRTVGPAIEPVTVADMLRHLRLDEGTAEPAPAAPTVALAAAGAGSVDNGAHRYRVTFVTTSGETQGGTISAAVTVVDKTTNGKVALTAIPLGSSVVTARKLYRTAAAGTVYLFLATLANNTVAVYTDNTADSALGAGVPAANTTNDDEIRTLITAARETVENHLRRPLITQTFRYRLDAFPTQTFRYRLDAFPVARCIPLPRPKLLTVTEIQYRDLAGAWVAMDVADYEVDTESFPGAVHLAYSSIWPLTQSQPGSVKITFTAGFGPLASDVPQQVIAGLKLIATDLWENRQAVNVGDIVNALPGAQRSLDPFRFKEIA